jgi:hypothetical protein
MKLACVLKLLAREKLLELSRKGSDTVLECFLVCPGRGKSRRERQAVL